MYFSICLLGAAFIGAIAGQLEVSAVALKIEATVSFAILASTVAAEIATILKSYIDLKLLQQVKNHEHYQEEIEAYSKISSSLLTLILIGALIPLGNVAGIIAKRLVVLSAIFFKRPTTLLKQILRRIEGKKLNRYYGEKGDVIEKIFRAMLGGRKDSFRVLHNGRYVMRYVDCRVRNVLCEIKSGGKKLTPFLRRQIEKDIYLKEQGYTVKWILYKGGKYDPRLLQMLQVNGIPYEYVDIPLQVNVIPDVEFEEKDISQEDYSNLELEIIEELENWTLAIE